MRHGNLATLVTALILATASRPASSLPLLWNLDGHVVSNTFRSGPLAASLLPVGSPMGMGFFHDNPRLMESGVRYVPVGGVFVTSDTTYAVQTDSPPGAPDLCMLRVSETGDAIELQRDGDPLLGIPERISRSTSTSISSRSRSPSWTFP